MMAADGSASRISMSPWMYAGPAMAGLLGGIAITICLDRRGFLNSQGCLSQCLVFALAVLSPFTVYMLWRATSVPFWVSLVILPVALFSEKIDPRGKSRVAREKKRRAAERAAHSAAAVIALPVKPPPPPSPPELPA